MSEKSILKQELETASEEAKEIIMRIIDLELKNINNQRPRVKADIKLIVEEIVVHDLESNCEEKVG